MTIGLNGGYYDYIKGYKNIILCAPIYFAWDFQEVRHQKLLDFLVPPAQYKLTNVQIRTNMPI